MKLQIRVRWENGDDCESFAVDLFRPANTFEAYQTVVDILNSDANPLPQGHGTYYVKIVD